MTTGMEVIPARDIRNALINMTEVQSVSSEEVQQDIVRRILAAETIEEAAQSFESVSAVDVEGIPLEVHGIAWLKSTFKEGPPVYALVDCLPKGAKKRVTVSIGGRSVMAFLLWAQEHKAMPFKVAFIRSEPGGENGYRYWQVKLATDSASGK